MKQVKLGNVMLWLVVTFLTPPVVWLLAGIYVELWTLEQMVSRIMLTPYIWTYVALFVGFLVLLARTNLKRIEQYRQAPSPETLVRAQRSSAFLPVFSVLWMAIYCVAGPNVALLGQTLDKPFLDGWGYLIAELLAIPLILLFSIPFFIRMTIQLERFSQGVPLSDQHRFLSLRGKLTLSFVFNLVGATLSMAVAAMSIAHAGELQLDHLFGKLMGALLILGVVATINLLLMSQQIIRPVRELSSMFNRLFSAFRAGKADLTQRTNIASRDELGYLAADFNVFLQSLAKLVHDIQGNVHLAGQSHRSLTQASERNRRDLAGLKTRSGDLGRDFSGLQGKIDQAKASAQVVQGFLDKTIALVDSQASEVGRNSAQMDSLAQTLARLSHDADSGAQEGQAMLDQARTGERDLAQLHDQIQKVGASAEVIQEAVKVIQNLGEQTNLLAMNASIEAAHAGSAGRGFAVVAAEIRKLAEGSRRSSVEISTNLNQVTQIAHESLASADRTSASFRSLVQSVDTVTKTLLDLQARLAESADQGQSAASGLNTVEVGSRQLQQETTLAGALVNDIGRALEETATLGRTTLVELEKVEATVTELNSSMETLESDEAESFRRSQELENRVSALKT